MNLHSLVSGAIGAVNPLIPCKIRQSTGYTTQTDGKRVPAYADPVDVMIQRQDLSNRDLRQIEGLNIQGITCAAYVQGNWYGINRTEGQGGDLFDFNGQTWLVVAMLEAWPDWCKVALCLQR